VNKVLVVLIALFTAVPVLAASARYTEGNRSVTLTDAPCVNEGALSHVQPAHRSAMRAGVVNLGGEIRGACWTLSADGAHVVLVLDDGRAGVFPAEVFVRADDA